MFKINNLIYQSKIKLKEVVSGYSHCGCQVMVPVSRGDLVPGLLCGLC